MPPQTDILPVLPPCIFLGERQLTISVTDKSGTPLAKNEIILTAGSKSVQTTVAAIRNWNHQQIIDFINRSR
ncbi:MAG: hypothetical protein LBT46_13140 [Planctomycetaceae bacterium]|nr:hypothetical protein [Planctomycetaceae bacterium]